ncbi:monovalent cation/H+ antiporter complex subunit F [Candidatus Bipolaricaulota sp. J31]
MAVLVSAVPAFLRLWRGPSFWDRVAGANSLNVRVALALSLEGVLGGRAVLLDVALAYALLGFLGAVLLARFGERGER